MNYELLAYLACIWGDALATDPTLRVVGWEKSHQTSFATRNTDDLARWLIAQNKTSCVYVHVGLVRSFSGSRPCANDIACVPGLWADVDVRDPVHAEPNLPPSLDVVRSFLATLPLVPSVVVFTGHGLLGWWLFREPFFVDCDADREKIATLSARWQAYLRERLGFAMDATHDLARLTRPAGVVNRKAAPPVATRIVAENERRYSLDDFVDVGLPEIGATPKHRAIDDAKFPPARLEPIVRGCAWMRHCCEDAAMLSEPDWYAMLGVLGRCEDGARIAHEWSRPYPRYTKRETDRETPPRAHRCRTGDVRTDRGGDSQILRRLCRSLKRREEPDRARHARGRRPT